MNKKNPALTLPPEMYENVRKFLIASARIYGTEPLRRAGLIDLLQELLGKTIRSELHEDQSSSDGVITFDISTTQSALLFLLELKNEVGTGHCDPSVQASLSFTRHWSQNNVSLCRDRTFCSSFLLSIAGPWVSVHGGILLGQDWIVQPLTDFKWMGCTSDFDLDDQVARVAHLFYYLREGLTALEKMFKKLANSPKPPPPCFPHIISYNDEALKSVRITYKKRLHCPDHRKTTSIFLAADQEGNLLFVKFTTSYNATAHRLLAKDGYAPRLIHCSKPVDDCFFMVVMEYIESESMAECEFTKDDLERVRKAKDLLHGNNYVFGDLRANNIVKPKNGSGVMLVDFDWCDVEGEGRYPLTINQDRACGWHADVKPGAIMRREHDNHLLRVLQRIQPSL
ncbi:hypothetical protein CPB86DRAFT_518461 [Serendipita vermifera]|nr:hypothetical protein CPB86DRAFT_518461 [Serendipita vermifera]